MTDTDDIDTCSFASHSPSRPLSWQFVYADWAKRILSASVVVILVSGMVIFRRIIYPSIVDLRFLVEVTQANHSETR